MIKQKKLWDNILTGIMALLCLLWIYPIVLILLNSLKKEGTFTTSTVFQLPTSETFAGLSNYVYGVIKMGFLSSLGYSSSLPFPVWPHPAVLLHDRLVPDPREQQTQQVYEPAHRVLDGRPLPDGHVHSVQDRRYPQTEHPLEHLHHLPGLWCRSGRVHVHRLYEERSHGDRGGCHDRWL
mgnify:CR=1 FL=1